MPSPTPLLRLALAASLAAVAIAPDDSRTGAAQQSLVAPNASPRSAFVSPAYVTTHAASAGSRIMCRPTDPSCPPRETVTPVVHASSAGAVTLAEGKSPVLAEVETRVGHAGSIRASHTLTLPGPPPVSVVVTGTPSSVTLPGARSDQSVNFTVRNAGAADTRVLLRGTCGGAAIVSVCTSTMSEVYVRVGETVPARVNVTTIPGGGTATVYLIASDPATGADVVSGAVGVSVSTAPAAIVTVKGGPNVEKSLCPTFALAAAVASQCGAARIAHALPSTRTYGKTYTPTLAYYQDNMEGNDILVDVALAASTAAPAQVRVVVYAVAPDGTRGGAVADKSFTGSEWASRTTRRVNLRFLPASNYVLTKYAVEVLLNNGAGWSTAAPLVPVEMIQVSRNQYWGGGGDAWFGNGWGLLGLERLMPNQYGDIVTWVGGDGSTRKYTPVQTIAGTTAFVTLGFFRADSLYRLPDGTFRRPLRHGASVLFDALGRHTSTVDRHGRATQFGYEATGIDQGRLHTITVPGNLTYVFDYSAAELTITAPGGRIVRVQRTAPGTQGIDAIVDPDGSTERFGYAGPWGGNWAILYFTDKRGTRSLLNWEDYGETMSQFVPLAPGNTPLATTTLASVFGRNASPGDGSSDASLPHFIVDGPRTNVGDVTQVWTDSLGAVTRTVDATGRVTTIEHGDPRFPGLATKVVNVANGFETRASYDAQGRLAAETEVNPYGDGKDATTTYTWDPTWNEVTKVVSAEGVVTTFGVNATTGNVEWQESPALPGSRTTYQYSAGLLTQVTIPGVSSPWIYTYNGMGNLSSARSPLGRTTSSYADVIGRDTLVVSPIIATDVARTRTTYDVMGRVKSQTTTAQGQSLTVATEYETGGAPLRVTRTVTPDPNALGSVVLAWEYDALGRQTREYEPATNQTKKNWSYDLAGNVIQEDNGQGGFTVEYDALNRRTHVALTRPASPHTPQATSDDQWFTYGADGALKTANNRFAQIGRSYYPNGALRDDTLRIATGDLSTFGQHNYAVQYGYDLDGRKKWMKLPAQLAIGGDSLAYGYEPSTGALAWVEDGARRHFTYAYTLAGQPRQLTSPTGTVETKSYNDDGELVVRMETSPLLGLLHLDTLRYDLRGKLLSGSMKVRGLSARQAAAWTYDGMGAVTSNSETHGLTVNDALGNASGGASYPNGENRELAYTYEPGSTRLRTFRSAQGTSDIDVTSYWYNFTGATTNSNRQIYAPPVCAEGCPQGTPLRVLAWDDLVQYYDGIGRLTVARRTTSNDQSGLWLPNRDPNDVEVYPAFERGVDEEYRYDALGRRVWVRAKREAHCPGPNDRDSTSYCLSTVERTVYDGDQVLFEIRQNAADDYMGGAQESDVAGVGAWTQFGVVGYTHGLGIDAPLAVNRDGVVGLLHRNFHGQVDQATGLNGQSLEPIQWPAQELAGVLVVPGIMRPGPSTWWGTLVQQKENATGLLDMRNRNFDPRTGRFTQEDPIGLVGGLNLYGFADGDPVNYSDPFGLWPTIPALCNRAADAASLAGLVARWNEIENKWNEGVRDISSLMVVGSALGSLSSGAFAATRQASVGTTVYRGFGDGAKQMGRSWTTVNPSTTPNFAAKAGLPSQNSLTHVVEGTLVEATGTRVTTAIPGARGPGGLPEIVIPEARVQVDVTSVRPYKP